MRPIFTVLSVLVALSAPVQASEAENDVAFLTVRNMGGNDFKLPDIKNRTLVKALKEEVAKQWNERSEGNYTADNIGLIGPGSFIGQSGGPLLYKDTDQVSVAAINASPNPLLWVFIKN